jgi:hypothetical protein
MKRLSPRQWTLIVSLVVLAAAVAAMVLSFRSGKGAPPTEENTVGAGLQLEMSKPDPKTAKSDTVRCFVDGKLVGVTTLPECAKKNGTASQVLDVGLDPNVTGSPAPAANVAPVQGASGPPISAAAAAHQQDCLRFAPDGWKGYGSQLALGACVRVLFQGQCVGSGDAVYGRWGATTLRLIPGRVEISEDNQHFRPLVAQDAQTCALAPM